MSIPKGSNPNHPVKGSKTRVGPIKRQEDIAAIKSMLRPHPRNYCLFVLGINTNLRASDLCLIEVGQVMGLGVMEELEITEKKTGKLRRFNLNQSCIMAIQRLIGDSGLSDGPLFTGQRGPLVPPTINALVKSWCRMIKLKGNFGSHTLRKTWGYHQRVTFSTGIPELMVCFNHSTQRQTLDYLCVQPEEIRSVYENEL